MYYTISISLSRPKQYFNTTEKNALKYPRGTYFGGSKQTPLKENLRNLRGFNPLLYKFHQKKILHEFPSSTIVEYSLKYEAVLTFSQISFLSNHDMKNRKSNNLLSQHKTENMRYTFK